MRAKNGTMAAIAAFAATVASAASITVDRVAQRWPWNNKVDIYYTVHGGQDVTGSTFARIEFTANIGGTVTNVNGNAIGASASDGEHVATWTAPTGLRATDCTMTAQLIAADAPSGDDYMIVDLATGAVTYEGLLASQDDSNDRYNTAEYKTGKMVLRKVPRWADRASLPNTASLPAAGYPTGDNTNYADTNSETNWVTKHAYYIGIFPVTQNQYQNITGSNPSWYKDDVAGNLAAHRPVEGNITWYSLRRPTGDSSDFASTSKIPSVSSNTGTFFQRLNYKTGLYFDLPTAIMNEIALRAGTTTVFYYGSDNYWDYVVCSRNGTELTSPVAVGSKKPNCWGLYDMVGNVIQLLLDDNSLANMANASDPFVPAWGGGTTTSDSVRATRPLHFSQWAHGEYIYLQRASLRGSFKAGTTSGAVGFRVAIVVD